MKDIITVKGNVIEFKQIINGLRMEEVKQLFIEYAQSLDIDLCFQNFEEELENLPGKYGPPHGEIIVAFVNDIAAGCVALHRLTKEICEMKRLYVRDEYRGLGIGKRLISSITEEASNLTYKYMRLDTLSTMKKAQDLYRSVGFYDIEPYVYNPIEGARYMELQL